MATTVVTVSKVISGVISQGLAIHNRLKLVKNNKKCCARLADRVKALVDPLEVLANEGVSEEVVQKAIDVFTKALKEAEVLMGKYEDTNKIKKAFNADALKNDFEEVNLHLSEASHHLSACLQVTQRNILNDMFNSTRTIKENFEDWNNDKQEWGNLLTETRNEVKAVHDVVDGTDQKVSALQEQVQDLKDAVEARAASQTSAASAASSAKATERVFNARSELINRIEDACLKALLDGLQKPTPDMPAVIKGRERNQVLQANSVTEDQVTCLIDMVKKKGERACERLISLLREQEPDLCEELGL